MKPHYGHLSIRTVKTSSNAIAIQVGYYKGKRFFLKKHIGSSKDQANIKELKNMAFEYIRIHNPQMTLDFTPSPSDANEIMFKRGMQVVKNVLEEAYRYLESVYQKLGFNNLQSDILKHMTIIRVLEPSSKIHSIELLEKYFDICYKKTTVFRKLTALTPLKDKVIEMAVAYAKTHLHFNFTLVFYDVTTLYFETDKKDDFRKCGFSKDNKINQPQIVIGLLVDKTGFPLYFDIFEGNTFEGKTMIPVILSIKKKFTIEKLTIVADAGMLSEANILQLQKLKIDYVVGARIKKLSLEQIKEIALKLKQKDKRIIKKGDILYEYSLTRAKKDKADNDRFLVKANYLLTNPSKIFKRSLFLQTQDKKNFILNKEMVEKYRLLEGIKGFKTNITHVPYRLLISRYRDLWHIEQSFRMAKSDLIARPIYHRKKNSIQYHILIVFMALCMSRVIEKEKGQTVKQVMDNLRDLWMITVKDEISGNELKLTVNKKPH